ncbi:MAG: HIT family protein [Actinomycetota bacterium]
MCLFCDIVSGAKDADVVYENDTTVAFLDIRPVFKGHTLVVPRTHVEILAELDDGLLTPLFTDVRLLSLAIPEAVEAEGSFVAINNKISQSVPHLHVHIVPRRRKDGLRGFFWPRHTYDSDEERLRYAEAIRARVKT